MDHEALLRDLYAASNARDVAHVYELRDGLVLRMDVNET
jgi:hypothetical protein